MLDLYAPGTSPLHRLPPGLKIVLLMLCGTALFVFDRLAVTSLALLAALLLHHIAGFGLAQIWQQIRPIRWILLLLLLSQGLFNDWLFGLFVTLRLIALLLLAGLVTLTTRASDMIATIEHGLAFLRPLGVNSAKVGLAFSLTLRFIPVLSQATNEVREAQKARGLERSILATALPVAVRVIKMADAISQAIDARGYDP